MQHVLPCARRTFQQNDQRLSVALDVFDLRGEVLFRHNLCRYAQQSYRVLCYCRCLAGSIERPQVQTQISPVQAAYAGQIANLRRDDGRNRLFRRQF